MEKFRSVPVARRARVAIAEKLKGRFATQALGDGQPVEARRDALQPVHGDHRGHRLRARPGEPHLADEAGAQPPEQRPLPDQDLSRIRRETNQRPASKEMDFLSVSAMRTSL